MEVNYRTTSLEWFVSEGKRFEARLTEECDVEGYGHRKR